MKDAEHRNQIEHAKRGDDKALYTVSPTHGYRVKREYHPEMRPGDMTTVERDIADRMDEYIRTNKEYIGTGTGPVSQSMRVLETHDMMMNPDAPRVTVQRASPQRASAVKAKQHASPSRLDETRAHSQFNQTIADMTHEASRISEELTTGKEPHASDAIVRSYEERV